MTDEKNQQKWSETQGKHLKKWGLVALFAGSCFAAGLLAKDMIGLSEAQQMAGLAPASGENSDLLKEAEPILEVEEESSCGTEVVETLSPAELLSQKLTEVQSTHVIRRYHNRFALLDLDALLEKQIEIEPEKSSLPETMEFSDRSAQGNSIHINTPNFRWMRMDNARPVDAMRLTFRGNGIPKRIEKLAGSKIVEPKLRAFYTAITRPTTTLWKAGETVAFTLGTFKGDHYLATSTPFIAIEKIAKEDYARMKSSALPYLWRAYATEEEQKNWDADNSVKEKAKEAPPDIDMVSTLDDLNIIEDSIMPGRMGQRANVEAEAEPSLLGDEADMGAELAVSALQADAEQLEALFYAGVIGKAKDGDEANLLRQAIVDQRRSTDFFEQSAAREHAGRMAFHDPEFTALFLVNNLFEQYNIFSVFDEGVRMRINAIDNRLNMVYTSYNLEFMPKAVQIPKKLLKQYSSETQKVRVCDKDSVHISDEFFLITASPHSYLIRVYLPRCGDDKQAYEEVDYFLSNIRLLDESTYKLKRWLQ